MTLAYDNHEAIDSWVRDLRRHKDLYFKLPRKIRSGRCVALDKNGERCKKKATIQSTFSGNPELAGGWVLVNVCQKHSEELC